MHLSRFPRFRFAHLNTPLEPMERLSKHLSGPRLWIKRDDCTGLAGGGNKVRKLEFLMADALAKGADAIITHGAVQSNHVRQTAAIAAKLRLRCHVLLEERVSGEDADYYYNGNVLLDNLLGASLTCVPVGTDMSQAMQGVADELRGRGANPYLIPGGGSNQVGALGYVNAVLELLSQVNSMGLRIDRIIHATGSAGTQAGLVAGMAMTSSRIRILGIGVRAPEAIQQQNVLTLARWTASHLGIEGRVSESDVLVNCSYIGAGYGVPTREALEAIKTLAQTESVLLDPVYSGKAMAGLIDLVKKGHFGREENIVFWHTGGTQALFAYRRAFGFPDYRLGAAGGVEDVG